tara:strand:- start:7 stop:117 length:111 start_codon:yes stop_codon:yes gene_type:complete
VGLGRLLEEKALLREKMEASILNVDGFVLDAAEWLA